MKKKNMGKKSKNTFTGYEAHFRSPKDDQKKILRNKKNLKMPL